MNVDLYAVIRHDRPICVTPDIECARAVSRGWHEHDKARYVAEGYPKAAEAVCAPDIIVYRIHNSCGSGYDKVIGFAKQDAERAARNAANEWGYADSGRCDYCDARGHNCSQCPQCNWMQRAVR